MNIFAFLPLLSFVLAILIGSFVYFQNRKNTLNKTFFSFCLFAFFWGLGGFMLRQVETFEAAAFWIGLIMIVWPFAIVSLVHFSLVFAGKEPFLQKKIAYVVLYGPALIVAILSIIPGFFDRLIVTDAWGYTIEVTERIWLWDGILIWALVLEIISVTLCISYAFMTHEKNKKMQSIFILIGIAVPIVLGNITHGIIGYLMKERLPELTTSSFGWIVAFVGYAIWKYELFSLTPAEAADNIISTMVDALILVSANGRILTINPASLNLLGYKKDEIIGKPFDVLIGNRSTSHGMELQDLIANEAVKNKETTLMTKMGKEIPVLFSSSIIQDKNSNIVGIVCIARDITERKQTEEALRESEERYKSLSEVTLEGILFHDKGLLVDANSAFAKMFGYELKELIGEDVIELLALPEYRDVIREKIAAGFNKPYEIMAKRKDGTIIPLELEAREAHYKGKILRVASVRDITARKQAEEEKEKLQAQLAQAQKMEAIGTLAGGMAHNFNNLLMSIQGNASLMFLETDSSHPNYGRVKSIEKSVQNGSRLTRQLLGYAREGRYEIRPISLNQMVEETSYTFGQTKKEIRVHRDLGKDLFGINADQGQVEQVLLNLYVNAADAMPGGGDLFLKTTNATHKDMRGKHYKARPGNYVLLTVRDTGIGMDKKTKDRVFDPFFTTKGMGRGTGLGLASVYGIVKAHGGYIDVESKKGHGTTFEIYLPASEKRVIEKKKVAKKVLKGSETVLLVDDEDMIIDVGSQMLKKLGYEALVARSGKEAIELYKSNKNRIDMILLDMVMPDMGGGEAYDRMREINPNVKVLLLSGYSIEGQATEILQRGCNGFIQKPFNMKELSQRVREILDSK